MNKNILIYINKLDRDHKLIKEGQCLNMVCVTPQTGVSRSLTHISEFLQESVLCSPFTAPAWLPREPGGQGWEVCLWPGPASGGWRRCADRTAWVLGCSGIPPLSSHSRSLFVSRTLSVGAQSWLWVTENFTGRGLNSKDSLLSHVTEKLSGKMTSGCGPFRTPALFPGML